MRRLYVLVIGARRPLSIESIRQMTHPIRYKHIVVVFFDVVELVDYELYVKSARRYSLKRSK